MSENKKLSFVIPCYRSEKTVMTVVDEIEETVVKRPEFDYEIILVNDGSPDNVWSVIEKRAKEDEHVIGINLAKNFGQHCALMAGYNQTIGDYVLSLDDDGQTPANAMFDLIDKLEEGFDIVFASYPETHQNVFRRWGSNFAKTMTDFMFDVKGDDRKGSSYFVMRRFIVDEIVRYKHPYPYIAGLILRTTRNIETVPIEHRDRIQGKSGYNLRSLISLWLNGFTAFSVKPLELGAYIGFFTAVVGFIFVVYTIVRKLINPDIMMGWSSLMAVLLIISGVIMIMLGMIGEYIGRIYICINNSPQYVVKEVCKRE